MKLILFVSFVFVTVAALAIWLLPLWLSIPLVLVVGLPLGWVLWKVARFIKTLKKEFGDLIPKEQTKSLASGEAFLGHGFKFTFPVACEVSQTHFHDVEALLLKPKLDFPGAPKDSLLVASTFSREELKQKINETIERVFAQVQESRKEEFAPVQVGQLEGERRTFTAAKDGKTVRCEAVYLGDQSRSLVWVAISPEESFEALSAKYRELAVLIQRADAGAPAAA